MEVGKRLIMAVFGGLIAYYVTTIFTTSLITGTTTADALNCKVMGALGSNAYRKTGLNGELLTERKDNAVLNSGNEPDKCVETIHPASKMDDDIVRTSQKCETNVGHHQPAPDYVSRRRGCHRNHRSLQRSLVL